MGNFYTDVIKKDSRFNSLQPVHDMMLLELVTRARVQAIIADAAKLGVNLTVYETFRSQARQTKLYEQGATKLKDVGVHHYGLACDLVRNVAGQPSWKGDFKFLAKLAQRQRMIWGGDWGKPGVKPGFYDPYHVQRCTVARQASLFAGKWYPDESYDPFE